MTSTDINDLALGEGYTVRALVPGDAHAVFELMAEQELETIGEVAIEERDIVADWQRGRASTSPRRASASSRASDSSGTRRWPLVGVPTRPSRRTRRGRGIGTELARCTQRISRRDGKGLVGMPAPRPAAAGAPRRRHSQVNRARARL